MRRTSLAYPEGVLFLKINPRGKLRRTAMRTLREKLNVYTMGPYIGEVMKIIEEEKKEWEKTKSFEERSSDTPKAFSWDKPFTTRSGREARRLGVLKDKGEYPNVVALEEKYIHYYTNGGKYHKDGPSDNFDLINTPEPKKKGWINIYGGTYYREVGVWDTRELADKARDCGRKRVACIEIEYTEGEGL